MNLWWAGENVLGSHPPGYHVGHFEAFDFIFLLEIDYESADALKCLNPLYSLVHCSCPEVSISNIELVFSAVFYKFSSHITTNLILILQWFATFLQIPSPPHNHHLACRFPVLILGSFLTCFCLHYHMPQLLFPLFAKKAPKLEGAFFVFQ